MILALKQPNGFITIVILVLRIFVRHLIFPDQLSIDISPYKSLSVFHRSNTTHGPHWLQTPATSNTPEDLLKTLAKLNFLRDRGIHEWDLSVINPNRRKVLAQIGRHASNQLISRMNPNRRYPILVAFLYQALENITDEVIDIFDACLEGSYHRAKRDWEAYKLSISRTTNLKLLELKHISEILLNDDISDSAVCATVFQKYPRSFLEKSRDECGEIIRPKHDKFYDFWATRYSYIRQFSPELLDKVQF